jgi:hypothetical protein
VPVIALQAETYLAFSSIFDKWVQVVAAVNGASLNPLLA